MWRLQTEAARSRRSRRGSQRGTTLVEAAIVTLPFFLIIFGIVELGMQMATSHALTGSVKAGSRTASTASDSPDADFTILQALKRELSGLPKGPSQVVRIVIYKSTGSGAGPTTPCKTASVTGLCNHYVASDLNRPATDFGCTPGTPPDRFWCPADRKTALSGVKSPPDYIGVYIEVGHQRVSGLLGSNVTLKDYSVNQIEPSKL